jgi:hypothetical protein
MSTLKVSARKKVSSGEVMQHKAEPRSNGGLLCLTLG